MTEFDFNRSFGFVLYETARLLSKRFDQRSKSLGLTRAQCQVLAYLVYHEGINQAGLAELLELEPISLGRLIDRMAQAGWVERRPDPQDRRAWQLFITEKAKPLFAEMIEIGRDVRAEALAGFTQEESDKIMDLLLRARRNLSVHMDDQDTPRPDRGSGGMSVLSDTRGRFGSRNLFLRIVLMASIPLVLIAIAAYLYLTAGRSASTDDAYVQADKIVVSSDVSARVVAVEVKDNQPVKTGQVLIKLDDSNYKIALFKAQANLAATKLQIDGLRATYKQREADLKAAQDTLAYMQREADRQAQLLTTHITSQQKYDEARHNLDAARGQFSAAQQQLANVLASLGGKPDIPTDQHPLVLQAQAQVDQAALDLSHTVIRASADGYVALVNRLPVGQYLSAATPAFNLVTTDRAWIEANFKETDLTRMRPGQNADCDIDTYPDRSFRAHVDSISAGTGSEFSVLPAQNSTGNWVKIVQRVPVRLAIDNPDPNYPLRAGMSATCTVDTRTLPPWNTEQTASAPQH